MNKLVILTAVMIAVTGCMTERTHRVVEGETAEETAGINDDDIRRIVSRVIQDIDRCSKRYSYAQQPVRVVNVKERERSTQWRAEETQTTLPKLSRSVSRRSSRRRKVLCLQRGRRSGMHSRPGAR